jgi:hypothetical protein
MSAELKRYNRRAAKYNMYQAIGWNIGLYLFNISSAAGYSQYFKNDEPRNPIMAGWLSAVPLLGLGQIYNGSVSKAGIIWMSETMFFYMAYNYNRLLNDCSEKRISMTDTADWRFNYRTVGTTEYEKLWKEEYNSAFKLRNTYLWYGIFFYFYGIFDAVVDAHLHDYNRKIRMEPVWDYKGESIGVSLSLEL